MPLMTFLLLGIIQLTMLQQAHLMTEYAAYQACRAGVVWNGEKTKMLRAARVALAPTIAHSNLYLLAASNPIRPGVQGLLDLGDHIAAMEAADAVLARFSLPTVLRLEVLNPTTAVFNSYQSRGPSRDELEFDDVGYFDSQGSNRSDGFAGDEGYRQALQLTVRMRYFYEMRIPFADWVIQTCFFAANAPGMLSSLHGALGRETVDPTATSVSGGDEEETAAIEAAAAETILNGAKGAPIMTKADFLALLAAREAGIIVVPLVASYTMRMQSNFYRKNLTN